MPYNLKNPPKDLKKRIKKRYPKATKKDIRQFIHIFNASIKDGDEESAAFSKAWGVLKRKSKLKKKAELLHGGAADNIDSSSFNSDDLEQGISHELEHTDNRDIATEIAKDHLIEDPNYYKKLESIEAFNAFLLVKLIKIASDLDEAKQFHTADLIDQSIEKIVKVIK